MNDKTKAWIKASRLRTLPLALSCIGMGGFLAAVYNHFSWAILFLSLLTTIFLQVLSNLANDYGDSVSGVDGNDREGPGRAVQAGLITLGEMKRAIIVMAGLSFVCGVSLVVLAFQDNWQLVLTFLILGLLSIYAAITYTAGKSPYGYAGLGDISVFIFFGLIGVMGSFYLHTGYLVNDIALPAASCGLLATGVLNVNNIRDIISDSKAGKRSIPVRLGRKRAVYYHWSLLILAIITAIIYVIFNYSHPAQFSFLLVIPLLIKNALAVYQKEKAMELDPYLKQMAITTMFFVLIFGISHILVA
ncbi:MAG: 1,4-dihydroxy-2-naphthoate polyprenyltransferase [Cyclobacteriaceae bacterium]